MSIKCVLHLITFLFKQNILIKEITEKFVGKNEYESLIKVNIMSIQ